MTHQLQETARSCISCDGSGLSDPTLAADDAANEMCPVCKGRGTTNRVAVPDRLWWLRKATGYDERRPGTFYPHLFLADGSIFGEGVRWRAGDECAHLTGWHDACELEGFGEHIFRVNLARRDYPDYPAPEFVVLPPGRWWDPMRSRRVRRTTEQIKRICYCCQCGGVGRV